MQTQASATNKVAKTLNQLLLFKKVKKIKDEMVCQGILSWPLVKAIGLWWIKRMCSTTAFPSRTLDTSSAIKNQHPENYNHFIHQIIQQCWDGAMGRLVTPETKSIAWARTKTTEATATLHPPPAVPRFLVAKAWGATSHGTLGGCCCPTQTRGC